MLDLWREKRGPEDVTKIHSPRSPFCPPQPQVYCLIKQELWHKAHGLYRKQVTCGAGDLQFLSMPSRFTYSLLLSLHTFLNINVLAKCAVPYFHSFPELALGREHRAFWGQTWGTKWDNSLRFNEKEVCCVSVADGIRGGGEVGIILNGLSLYARSNFRFKIQQALEICHYTLPPGLVALPCLLGWVPGLRE